MSRLLLIVLLVVSGSALRAEAPRRPAGPPAFSELADALSLRDDQRAQVEAIMNDQREQMRALREASREEHQQLRGQLQAKLAAILTNEQMQALKSFQHSHRPPHRSGEGKRRPPPAQD